MKRKLPIFLVAASLVMASLACELPSRTGTNTDTETPIATAKLYTATPQFTQTPFVVTVEVTRIVKVYIPVTITPTPTDTPTPSPQ